MQQRPNRITMSARVGNLKRAGTSYRLNQRQDMEYQRHGRRRSEPAVPLKRSPSDEILHPSTGRMVSSNSSNILDAMAAAAASEIECEVHSGFDEESGDEDNVRVNFETLDRLLRTRSLDFL